MLFSHLYAFADKLDRPPVGFDFLRAKVEAHHPSIGRVDTYAITYPEPNGQALYRLGEPDRTSGYTEEFQVAEIRFCETLANNESQFRYALTKELMHVFDDDAELTNTPELFKALILEIQNQPLPEHATPMYLSELQTRWMAVLILCPKRFRDLYLADYKAGKLAAFDIANTFAIPEWTVPFVMSDYYEVVHKQFVG